MIAKSIHRRRTDSWSLLLALAQRKDVAFADRIEAELRVRGIEALIDRSEIYAFEDWWKRVQDLIASADTFVFVISPDAVASDICRKEVGFAASLNKRFAPVVLGRADDRLVPEALARLNFIFFDDEAKFDTNLARLVEALTTDIGWIRRHTAVGEDSRRWMGAGRPGGLLLRSPLLEEAERWIAARPIWLYSSRAHALMLLDRIDEARVLYLKHRGLKNVQGDKSWEAVILEQFTELRKAGLTHPLMDEIEKTFSAGG